VKVWLTDWEWECCGDYFEVGSEVEWGVMPLPQEERAWLDALGEELLDTVTHFAAHEDHIYMEGRPPAVQTRGRVESVSAVYFKWARTNGWRRRSNQPALGSSELKIGWRTYRPVIGGAVLKARAGLDFQHSSDPALGEVVGGPQGFIVELSPVD
jgi:hypothetical protein